ncbi:ComEC/Rec2 family competence protein [Mycolicibacterium rufum]|uniref:ComEC/Rec2 family competence protein n=2 Tax=Mycolicibacterium rufum TaxID=318424 RepID=A0ABY3U9F0_9MYCO|nr:ComEC/Rec2 family competence protein [Mycolicibacterium rufum]KGI68979.1 competence protein [Mycolicibacterium rufum]ULP35147.1 ComEC/Rec2 family competence protein [Mycolicibacterium rufum]
MTDLRLVPAAATAWTVTAAGILWAFPGVLAALSSALAATVAAGWWAGRRRGDGVDRRALLGAAAAVALVGGGFAVAVCLRVDQVRHHPVATYTGSVPAVVVTPDETPRVVAGGRVMFRATLARLDGHAAAGSVLVFASGGDYAGLQAGRPAGFRARVGPPRRRDLTVAVLTATGPPRLGEAALMHRAAHRVRGDFSEAARLVLPAGQAALLPALVLGDTSAVPAPLTRDFRTAGLTHLTAVSGANVTIVCGAVLLTAVLIGPHAAVLLAALTLAGFVVVVQPSASVLRAAVMGAITLLAVLTHRRRQALPALAAAVVVLMIGAPELAVDVGFALSVSATAGLVLVAPAWSRRLTGRGWPRPLADAVSVALAAQLVTAPLVAGVSGAVSLVSVAANLLVAPVIPPITLVGTAAAALGPLWPAGAQMLIRFTGPEVWWLTVVARWAAAMPAASIPVPSGLAGVAIVAVVAVVVALVWHWALSGRRDTIVR